jgi:hypothetical protein
MDLLLAVAVWAAGAWLTYRWVVRHSGGGDSRAG